MAAPNIPAAKRAGLRVDLERLQREGDDWLTPEDRYALKTYGICAQRQDHVFMVRVRIPGGSLAGAAARGLARIGARHGGGWLHVTTRQNVELHSVADREVPVVLDGLAGYGLSTRSACGHTVRNVMSSEDAGVGLDEPFDCFPDARLVSDTLIARSAELNVKLPARVNVALGGSPRCRHDALLNDAGLVSVLVDGRPGYELWAGGSLGKAPSLAVLLDPFVPREDLVPAVEALVDVFVARGDLDDPGRGRMKYVLDRMGADAFRSEWMEAYTAARAEPHAPPVDVPLVEEADRVAILSRCPPGGWTAGVRPQRTAGLASVTIDLPLGDATSSEFELFATLADRHGDGHLTFTRDQNITFRNVALAGVAAIRDALGERGLWPLGEGETAQIRACTGVNVCALGITDSPGAGRALADRGSLRRNGALRVNVSGCPNSCAQHQAGDLGLAGSKVRVRGRTSDGYQIFLGADLDSHQVGEVVGRVAEADLDAAVDAVVGTWEALRHHGETLGRTVRRIGLDAFSNQIGAVLEERWAVGPEPETTPVPVSGG